jgi:hypothetical protein
MELLLAAEFIVALVALVAAGLLGTAVRRRLLQREGGTFDCSLRTPPVPADDRGKGWTVGLARYAPDTIEWYRVFSWSLRPRQVLPRRGLVVLSRRRPSGPEALALLSGAVVIECNVNGSVVELAMSEPALTGFLSWLEAAPPGQDVNNVA